MSTTSARGTLNLPTGLQDKLNALLRKAIVIDNADKGNIQLFDQPAGTLSIIAQVGFDSDFLKHFAVVSAFDSSACGRAVGIGAPVTIDDVTTDLGFREHRTVAGSASFRSVKSVPIINADKKILGIISTHFKDRKSDWNTSSLNGITDELAVLLGKI